MWGTASRAATGTASARQRQGAAEQYKNQLPLDDKGAKAFNFEPLQGQDGSNKLCSLVTSAMVVG